MYSKACVHRLEDNFEELVLFFHCHVSLGDTTHISRLVTQVPLPLSHLTDPQSSLLIHINQLLLLQYHMILVPRTIRPIPIVIRTPALHLYVTMLNK